MMIWKNRGKYMYEVYLREWNSFADVYDIKNSKYVNGL